MKKSTRIFSYLGVSALSILATLSVLVAGYSLRYFLFGTPVQTVRSTESGNVAVLREHFGIIDYNISVEVNGTSVYRSGDIQGISPTQLRGTLIWDKTGQVVVLELMGRPAFAYDAANNRNVGKSFIKELDFYPMPQDFWFAELPD